MERIIVFLAYALAAIPLGPALSEPAETVGPPGWAAVSAVFVERCVMCHSAQGAARGLRLDSYDAALAGGERGAVLIAGDPAGSELVRRLRGESQPRMPFLSYALPPETIGMIARWVAWGMPGPVDEAAPYKRPAAAVAAPADGG